MSSLYKPICVSHDPAIVIGAGSDWQSRDVAFDRGCWTA